MLHSQDDIYGQFFKRQENEEERFVHKIQDSDEGKGTLTLTKGKEK